MKPLYACSITIVCVYLGGGGSLSFKLNANKSAIGNSMCECVLWARGEGVLVGLSCWLNANISALPMTLIKIHMPHLLALNENCRKSRILKTISLDVFQSAQDARKLMLDNPTYMF